MSHEIFSHKYNFYGLGEFYKRCFKETLTKYLILVYGYDVGSAIAQKIFEDIISEEECPD